MISLSTRLLARNPAHSLPTLARFASTSSRLPFPVPSHTTLADKDLNNSILLPIHLHSFIFRDLLARGWKIQPKAGQSTERSFLLERQIKADEHALSPAQLVQLVARFKETSALHRHHTDEPLPSALSLPFNLSIITHRTRYPPTTSPGSLLDPDRPARPTQGLTLRDLHLAQAYEHVLQETLLGKN